MAGKHRSSEPDPERDAPTGRSPLRFLPLAAGAALVAVVALIAVIVAVVGGDDGTPTASARRATGSATPTGSPTGSSSASPTGSPSVSGTPSAPASSRAPTATPSAVPPPRPGYAQVLLRVIGPSSWARVRDGGGRVLHIGVLRRGASRSFSAPLLTVEVGNAGAVELVVNGRPRRPLGGQGQIARLVIRPSTR